MASFQIQVTTRGLTQSNLVRTKDFRGNISFYKSLQDAFDAWECDKNINEITFQIFDGDYFRYKFITLSRVFMTLRKIQSTLILKTQIFPEQELLKGLWVQEDVYGEIRGIFTIDEFKSIHRLF